MIFWTDETRLVPISLVVNGRTVGRVTSSFTSEPVCGRAGGVTLSLPPGSYPYSAASTSGYTGAGSVPVWADGCTALQLVSDWVTTGQVVFWTRTARLAPITVRVDGQPVGTVPAASASAPTCGQSASVTVTLDAGRHALAASNPSGTNWSGPFDIEANTCLALELY